MMSSALEKAPKIGAFSTLIIILGGRGDSNSP